MADHEKNDVTARTLSPAGETVFKTGNLEFVAEQGDNGAKTTYQEASGAPVEAHSPLPARVQWFTIIFLNLGQMIGTGVFSTRKSINTTTMWFRNLLRCSWLNPQGHWICRPFIDVLGHRLCGLSRWSCGVSRAGIILPFAIRRRSRIP